MMKLLIFSVTQDTPQNRISDAKYHKRCSGSFLKVVIKAFNYVIFAYDLMTRYSHVSRNQPQSIYIHRSALFALYLGIIPIG